MARKTEILRVDDAQFEVEQLPIEEGLELYDELLRAVGEGLGSAASSIGKGDVESVILAAFVRSLGSLPPGLLSRLGQKFAKYSKLLTVAGTQTLKIELNAGTYDAQFGGRLGHWTRWVIACLRFNFSDFLPATPPDENQLEAAATK